MHRKTLPGRWTAIAVCLFLAAISWAVFAQTLGYEFINLDGAADVLKNPHLVHGLTWAGTIWAFTSPHLTSWQPLTWISHMLDCQFFGVDPRGPHLVNLLLHISSAIALFLILWRMLGMFWRCAFVAAIFAVHPLQVESVAWIAQRQEVLGGFYCVLTLGAYARYARSPAGLRYLLVLFLFVLGLMSNPVLVTLPFLLLFLDAWPFKRLAPAPGGIPFSRLLLEKLPLFVLSGLTIFLQGQFVRRLLAFSRPLQLGSATVSGFNYLRDIFWPANIAPLYPANPATLSTPVLLPAAVTLAGISIIALVLRRRRYLRTGWFWFIILLVPVIGIISAGEPTRADHYTYLPQIGIYLALTWAVAHLLHRWRQRAILLAPLAVAIIGACAWAAQLQARHWQSSETLWRYTLAHTANNSVAHRYLGQALFEKGKPEDAIAELEQSLQLDDRQEMAQISLGAILLELGRIDEATGHFEAALALNPDSAEANSDLGLILLERGQPEESLIHLERSVQTDPDFGTGQYNLGNTLLKMGRAADAVAHYRKAIEINPGDVAALNNAAWILATSPDDAARNGALAVQFAGHADLLSAGKQPVAAATLAAAYAEAGRFDEASDTAKRAMESATILGNANLAESIRRQRGFYLTQTPFRDETMRPSAR